MASHRSNGEAGMTLVEVLFASAIGAVLLTSLALASGLFVDSYSAGLDEQDLALSHHIALERILSAITTAGTVTVESSTSLLRNVPAGGSDRFTWSGTAGDSLNLIRDDGDAIPFVDLVEVHTAATDLDGDGEPDCATGLTTIDLDGDGHADGHLDVQPGVGVCWDVYPKENDWALETSEIQVFVAELTLRGNGAVLDVINVWFVVPPAVPMQ